MTKSGQHVIRTLALPIALALITSGSVKAQYTDDVDATFQAPQTTPDASSAGAATTPGTETANLQLVDKGDVTFGVNRTDLSPEAKLELDRIATHTQSVPRAVVEVIGFADKTGSKQHNMALSQRRAESVQQYLAAKNVPMNEIHVIGMGEEEPPPDLRPDITAVAASNGEHRKLARRVRVRVFGADVATGYASRQADNPTPSAQPESTPYDSQTYQQYPPASAEPTPEMQPESTPETWQPDTEVTPEAAPATPESDPKSPYQSSHSGFDVQPQDPSDSSQPAEMNQEQDQQQDPQNQTQDQQPNQQP